MKNTNRKIRLSKVSVLHYIRLIYRSAIIKCTNCNEKLCTHKKQLHTLWRRIEAYYEARKKWLKDSQ